MRTTVGRFWGYSGVLIALLVSLAGNIESAKLHTPFFDPSRVEYAFAGLPPLVAFISIEIVNHNPWANIAWGKWVTRVLLFVVAPGSALVSFVHLTLVGLHSLQVPIPDWLQMWLNIATAILTALLIDGLILGGTAALLLPKSPATQAVSTPAGAIEAYPDWRGEMARLLADVKPVKDTPPEYRWDRKPPTAPLIVQKETVVAQPPKIKARLAAQKPDGERKRFPPRQHPLWPDYVEARERGVEPEPQTWAALVKTRMDKDMDIPAARTMLGRWSKEYEKA